MKILLAIDGSPCSETAVAEVARRPWPEDSQLRVVSVAEPPGALTAEPYMGVAGYFEEVERLKRRQAEEVPARSAEVLRAGAGTAQMGSRPGRSRARPSGPSSRRPKLGEPTSSSSVRTATTRGSACSSAPSPSRSPPTPSARSR